MNITMYKMTKDRLIINKDIENNNTGVAMTAYARGEFDIENPIITVDSAASNITLYNYVYIEDYNRYYFVTRHKCVRTGIYELTCEEDYLYTWKNTIYNWTVELERGQYDYNLYFKDEAFMALEGHNLNVLEFPNALPNGKHNILIVNGGR